MQDGDVMIVRVSGRLDITRSTFFRKACFHELMDKKVIFQLSELTFVGSTGIQTFFQVVKDLHTQNPYGVRVVGLSSDFLKVFHLHSDSAPCLSSLHEALSSFRIAS